MILYMLLTFASLVYADPTWKWSNAIKIVEKHEFYKDNEIISKPKNSWQTLFAVLYHDSNLKTLKDCVYYLVPGEENGKLKIKTMSAETKCEAHLFQSGDQEWIGVKALQYSVNENLLSISLTNAKYQIEKWDVPLFNVFEHPVPKGLMSSAEYRSPKIIYLTPYKGEFKVRPQRGAALADKQLCHDIGEDCQEKSPSVCGQCSEGWYETPNGCAQGPKYCGSLECGKKNQIACRRGMKYQGEIAENICVNNSSFAYCSKGLSVHCQGNLPYCL
jgi:hypothetical protein